MAARVLMVILLQLIAGGAQACLFVKDIRPSQWYEWSSALFAGEVTRVEQDAGKMDVITVRVSETFKGPQGDLATLRVPSRMWTSCRMKLPAVGTRVLVAINPNQDTALVPLRSDHAAVLRTRRTNGLPGGSSGAIAAGE